LNTPAFHYHIVREISLVHCEGNPLGVLLPGQVLMMQPLSTRRPLREYEQPSI
jgi:hypothetical protein